MESSEIRVKTTDGEEVGCGEAHMEAEEHGQRMENETGLLKKEDVRMKEANFEGLTALDVTSAQTGPKIVPAPSISHSQACLLESKQISSESRTSFKEENSLKLSHDLHTPPNTIADGQLVAGERPFYSSGSSNNQPAKDESNVTVSPPLCRTGLSLEDFTDIPQATKIQVKMTDGEEVGHGEAHMESEEYGQRMGYEAGLKMDEGSRMKEADLTASDVTSAQSETVSEVGRLLSIPEIVPVPSISDSQKHASELEQTALEATTQFKEENRLKSDDMNTPPNTIADNQLVACGNGGTMTLSENKCLSLLDVMGPVTELTVHLSCQQGAEERTYYPSGSSGGQPAKEEIKITVSPPSCRTGQLLEDGADLLQTTKIRVKMTDGDEVGLGEAHVESEEYRQKMVYEAGLKIDEGSRMKEADLGGLTTSVVTSAQTETVSEVGRLLSDPRVVPVPSISDSQKCASELEETALESTTQLKEEKGLKLSHDMHTPPNTIADNQLVAGGSGEMMTLSENQCQPVLDIIGSVTKLTADSSCQQEAGERTYCPSGSSDDQPAKEECKITVSPTWCRTGLLVEDMKSEADSCHTTKIQVKMTNGVEVGHGEAHMEGEKYGQSLENETVLQREKGGRTKVADFGVLTTSDVTSAGTENVSGVGRLLSDPRISPVPAISDFQACGSEWEQIALGSRGTMTLSKNQCLPLLDVKGPITELTVNLSCQQGDEESTYYPSGSSGDNPAKEEMKITVSPPSCRTGPSLEDGADFPQITKIQMKTTDGEEVGHGEAHVEAEEYGQTIENEIVLKRDEGGRKKEAFLGGLTASDVTSAQTETVSKVGILLSDPRIVPVPSTSHSKKCASELEEIAMESTTQFNEGKGLKLSCHRNIPPNTIVDNRLVDDGNGGAITLCENQGLPVLDVVGHVTELTVDSPCQQGAEQRTYCPSGSSNDQPAKEEIEITVSRPLCRTGLSLEDVADFPQITKIKVMTTEWEEVGHGEAHMEAEEFGQNMGNETAFQMEEGGMKEADFGSLTASDITLTGTETISDVGRLLSDSRIVPLPTISDPQKCGSELDDQSAKNKTTFTISPLLCQTRLLLEDMKTDFPYITAPLGPSFEESFSHTQAKDIANERMEDQAKMSEALRLTETHVGALMHTSMGFIDEKKIFEALSPVNFQTSELKYLESMVSSLSQSKPDESLRNCPIFTPIIPQRNDNVTDTSLLTVMKEQLSVESEINVHRKRDRKKNAMPAETVSFPQEWDVGPSNTYERSNPYLLSQGNNASEQWHIRTFNQTKNKRKNVRVNREIMDRSTDVERVEATTNQEQCKTVLDLNAPQSQPSKKCHEPKKGLSFLLKTVVSGVRHSAVDSIDVEPEEKSGQPEKPLKSLMDDRPRALVLDSSTSGQQTVGISCEAVTNSVFLETAIPCAVQPVRNVTKTTVKHAVKIECVEDEKMLIDSHSDNSNLTECFEVVNKSMGIGQKVQRKKKKRRKAVRKKKAQTKFEVDEYYEVGEVPIGGVGDKCEMLVQCKNETETQMVQPVFIAQDKEEDAQDKSSACLRENETILSPENISDHNSQIHKKKEGRKGKLLKLIPPETHLRSNSRTCSDISVEPSSIPEKTLYQSPTVMAVYNELEGSSLIKLKPSRKKRARKSKKPHVGVNDFDSQETCIIIHKEEGGPNDGSTAIASNASTPNDTMFHNIKKCGQHRKKIIKEETNGIPKNLHTFHEVISNSFEQQSQNISQMGLLPSEFKNESEGLFLTSTTKKNVRKPKRQKPVSKASPLELVESKGHGADTNIPDCTSSLPTPQAGGGDIISSFTEVYKEAQGNVKKEMKAQQEIVADTLVKEEYVGAEERLKGIQVSGSAEKLKNKRGRPYKKKTLLKMAKRFAEEQRSNERDPSSITELGNDLLPQDVISHVPQKCEVKKVNKEVKQALRTPVTNLRRHSRACKLTPVEKMEDNLARDHNPVTLLASSTDPLHVQNKNISSSEAGFSVAETSEEIDGFKFYEQKPRRQGRPLKNKTESQAGGQEPLLTVHDGGAEAKSAIPINPEFIKQQKHGYQRKKALKEEITCIQKNFQTIHQVTGNPEQQGHNISQQALVSSSGIKVDLEGPSILSLKKNVKPKKQKCISTIFPEKSIGNTENKTVISQQTECTMLNTFSPVNKVEHCDKKMKGMKEEIIESTSLVGEYGKAEKIIVGPETSGTSVDSKRQTSRLCRKKTQKRKTVKEFAMEQRSSCVDVSTENQPEKSFSLDITSHVKKCKVKKESKKVKSGSGLPPLTHLKRSSRVRRSNSIDKMEHLCTENRDEKMSGSASQLISPKEAMSPSPAVSVVSNKDQNVDEHKPRTLGRVQKKERKPSKRNDKEQGDHKQILSVTELEEGGSTTTGPTELISNIFITHKQHVCGQEESIAKIGSGNLLDLQSCNVPAQALVPSENRNDSETFLPMKKKIKKCRKQTPNSQLSPEVLFENTQHSTDMSQGVANDSLISKQSGCEKYGTVAQVFRGVQSNTRNKKAVNQEVIKDKSTLGEPRKAEDILAIIQTGGAVTNVRRKLGRPYKKKTRMKIAKQLPFIEGQRLSGTKIGNLNQIRNHSELQVISSRQVQSCKQRKATKTVKIPRPQTPVAHLRRYSRACKVTTDYTLDKIKDRLEYNLSLSSSTYLSDTLPSFPKMDIKQEMIGLVQTGETGETAVQFHSTNTKPLEVQSFSQEHSNKKSLEASTVINSAEDTKVHENTTSLNNSLQLDTGITPSFQEIIECTNTHVVSKKQQKTIGSKKRGKNRRRTWWDDRGTAKRLLGGTLGTALEISQDESRLEPALDKKLPDYLYHGQNAEVSGSVGDTESIHKFMPPKPGKETGEETTALNSQVKLGVLSEEQWNTTKDQVEEGKVATIKSTLGEPRKADDSLAILQTDEAVRNIRKRGRPYKKKTLMKIAKQQTFIEEQRLNSPEIVAINQLENHTGPQQVSSHHMQSCNQRKTIKTVKLPRPPTPIAHLRRSNRAGKVTTQFSFDKMKHHVDYNLTLPSSTYVTDTIPSFPEMDVKQGIIRSVETEKTMETVVQCTSVNAATSEVQSLSQEHCNMKTLESSTVLNSLEDTKVLEDTTALNTSLILDTAISPSFQEIIELNSTDVVSKKPWKTIGSKKRGKKRRSTWWDDRGKAKRLLSATLGSAPETSQDSGKLEPALEEKQPDKQMYNSDPTLLISGQRIHEKYSDSDVSGAQLYIHSEKVGLEISVEEGPIANGENDIQHASENLETTTKMKNKSQESKDLNVGKEPDIAHVYTQNDNVSPNSCSSVGDAGTVDEFLPKTPEKDIGEETTTLPSQVQSAVLSMEQQSTTEDKVEEGKLIEGVEADLQPSADPLSHTQGRVKSKCQKLSVITEPRVLRDRNRGKNKQDAHWANLALAEISQSNCGIRDTSLESKMERAGKLDIEVVLTECESSVCRKAPEEVLGSKNDSSENLLKHSGMDDLEVFAEVKEQASLINDIERDKSDTEMKGPPLTEACSSQSSFSKSVGSQDIPLAQQSGSETIGIVTQALRGAHGSIKERKTVKEKMENPTSTLGEPRKAGDTLAIIQTAGAVTEVKRKLGRPYKKKTLIKIAKQLALIEEQRLNTPEIVGINQLENHPGPLLGSFHQSQTCMQMKTSTKVKLARPPTAPLRRYSRACKVTNDHSFDKIKDHVEYNLNLSSSTYVSDTFPSFPQMDVKKDNIRSVETEKTTETVVHCANTAPSELQSLSEEHSNVKTLEASTVEEIVELNRADVVSKKHRKTIGSKKSGKKRRRTWWDNRGKAKRLLGATLGSQLETCQDEGRLEPALEEKLLDEQMYNSDITILIPGLSGAQLFDVDEGPLASGEIDVQHASEYLEATPKMNCQIQESKDLEICKEPDIAHVHSQNAKVLPNSCSSVGDTGTVDEVLSKKPENIIGDETTTLLSPVESAVLLKEQQIITEDKVEEGKLIESLEVAPQPTVVPLGYIQETCTKSKHQKQSIRTKPQVLRDRTQERIKQDAHGANLAPVEMSPSNCEVPGTSLESTKEGVGKMDMELIPTEFESSAWAEAPEDELSTKDYSSETLLSHSGMEDSQVFAEVEEQSILSRDVQRGELSIEIKSPPLSRTCTSHSSFSKLVVSEDLQIGDEEKQEGAKGQKLADKGDRNNHLGDTVENITDSPNLTANPSGLLVSACLTKKGKFPTKCHFCGRSFRHLTAYIIHRRIHTGEKPYRCQECGKGFAQLSHLNVHRKVHKLPRLLQCPLCISRFSHRDKLISHFLTHTNYLNQKNWIGESVKKSAKINTSLSRSAFSMLEVKPFKCINCGKQFRYSVTLKRHTCLQSKDKLFSCKVCDKTFNKASKLGDHEKIHWPVKPFACSVCGKGFSQLRALRTHSGTHTGEKPFSCAHCGDAFLQLSSLRTHQASKLCLSKGTVERGNEGCMEDFVVEYQSPEGQVSPRVSFKCQVCYKSYDVQSEYNLHLLMHNDVQTSVSDACGQQFDESSDHNTHLQIGCGLNGMESQNSSLSQICDTFQHQNNQPTQSPDHLETLLHSDQQSQCTDPSVSTTQGSSTHPQKSCVSVELLEMHQSSSPDSRLVGTPTSRSKRPYCKHLKGPKRIKAHMMTSTPHYRYSCAYCGKALQNWNKHWQHQRVHWQKPGGFCCPQCSQHFHFHGLYKEHMLEHAKQNPFACPVCPISFADKESLMDHQVEEHRACKTHQCHTCGKRFTHLRNLERHNLLHRGAHPHRRSLSNRSFLRSGVLPHPLATHSHSFLLPDMPAEVVSRHRCGECNAEFTTLDLLAIHQLCHSTRDRNPQEDGEILAGSLAPKQRCQPWFTPSSTPVLSSSPVVSPDKHESLYAYQHPDNLYVYPTPSTSFPPPVLPSITNLPSYRSPSQINTINTEPTAVFNTSECNMYSKQVLADHLYAAPLPDCTSPAVSPSPPQLLEHLPQSHVSRSFQLSSNTLSLNNSTALASPTAQINRFQFRTNGDSWADFSSVPLSYVKLKSKEKIQESLECAECGMQFGAVSELYEHYIQHARGEV